MERIPKSAWREPFRVGVILAAAVAVALIVGFAVSAIWGAVITAIASSALTCLSLATSWSERRDRDRPRVFFYVHRQADDIHFTLVNVGVRPAFDVQVHLDGPVNFRLGEPDWADVRILDLREHIGFLNAPVVMLAPDMEVTSVNKVDTGADATVTRTILPRFLLAENEGISGRVTYRDHQGTEYSETVAIGFAAFKNMKMITTETRHSV